MDDFESFRNSIHIDYDSEDVFFTGYVYKLNRTQFKVVKRSAYGKVTLLNTSKILLNIMDKNLIYQLRKCVL